MTPVARPAACVSVDMRNRLSTEQERLKLAEVHGIIEQLPASCIAAICKHAIFALHEVGLTDDDEYVTLAELDEITDTDPSLRV